MQVDKRHFVHPDEVVYTKRGPKRIHGVTKADFVTTKNARFVPVAEVFKEKYRGKLYRIAAGASSTLIHENHEILVAHMGHSHYISAKHVTTDMEVISIIPHIEMDDIKITSKDMILLGIVLSAGKLVMHSEQKPRVTIARMLLSKFVEDQANEKGLNASINEGTGEITIDLPFKKEYIFDDFGNKVFHSSFALLPKEKLCGLNHGLLMSNDSDNEREIKLESRKLAEDLRLIFFRIGIAVDVLDSTIMKVSGGRWMDDRTFARKIESIDIVDFDGILYDLQTVAGEDSDSSYLTTFGINHNGGGKRNGSFAIYLEPWHGDIVDFLELKKPHGEEEKRARDLFYALWIPDLYMKRVESGGIWSLMDPNVSRGLADVWGEEFETLYEKYEQEGKYIRQLPARELWNMILTAQIETGTPYMLYKDSVNRKSNQSNLGTIKSSNLCTEIVQYTSPDEVSVCNLNSVSLPAFVDREDVSYNLDRLHATIKIMTRNLNKVIDINYYPVPEAETSNMRHRPIGIGIQGLADVFCMLKYPFESQDARKLNREIAETMYHAALESSCELAAERESEINEYKQLARIEEKSKEIKKQINGILKRTKFSQEELTRPHCQGAYDSYFWNGGCPVSRGILQYDMWGVTPSDRWDWTKLKEDIETHGIRNSLLIAPMPTASTSQILGNMESFEPYTSNIYTRRTMAGEFAVVNKHLMRDLIEMGLWNEDMKQQILAREGSVQDIDVIPKQLRQVYKTVWEVSQRTIIDMAADRGAFTCQSQSMNCFANIPTPKVLTSMHMYAYKRGLKTGCYYLRAAQKASTQKFTVDPSYALQMNKEKTQSHEELVLACSRENPESCTMCSG